jgi:hypothetical protein
LAGSSFPAAASPLAWAETTPFAIRTQLVAPATSNNAAATLIPARARFAIVFYYH